MIEGIGVDLVSIEKLKKILCRRGGRFFKRVFSQEEFIIIGEIKNKNEERAIRKTAGFFAAKEAFLKAVGGGLFTMPFNKISVLNDKNGKPYIKIDENLRDLIYKKFKKKLDAVNLSITHEDGFACAFVIIEML
ncbi:MAG: holo-ACP synthase [Deltaproteobacteria bacterium]|nr:holo-ACP synthase [Deltaproteobacteria bacterium]MCL5879634.1 holo-ACP synthase [Deltaproteobacteria bacterium]MDA8304883.1 holo-ACP synthase [Deltaproteobacteria bacterium]